MTTTPTEAARVRAMVDHPIIDADGHFVELGPLLHDEVISYVEDAGGAALRERFLATAASFDTSSSLADRDDPAVRDQWKAMPSWWGWQTAGVRDRATAHLPALLYERLDELGIDFTILYPSMALGYFEVTDEELSSVLCRAVNRYHARLFAPYRDRCTVGALIPMNTPAQAIAEAEYAVRELGAKSVLMAGYARRPIGAGGYRLDMFGLDSDFDYDPLWATCVDLGVAPVVHSALQQHRVTRSISNYVYNHVNGLAAAHESLCKSLFLAGVTRRFPELRVGFLEGGVAWACALFAGLVGHWEKRNRDAIVELDPDRLDVDALLGVLRRLRRRRGASRVSTSSATTSRRPAARPAQVDEFAAVGIDTVDDLRARFEPNFYFGCEADDPARGVGVPRRREPARRPPASGARFRHLALGRPRHDRTGGGGVRAGRTRCDHRTRLPRPHVRQSGATPRRAQSRLLRRNGVRVGGRGRAGARWGSEPRRRPSAALGRVRARRRRRRAGRPRAPPAPTRWSSTSRSRRRRTRSPSASAAARWRASSSTRWCRASCRWCSRACSRRRPVRRSRTSVPSSVPGSPASCCPRSQSPADVHALDALLTCTEVDFDLEPGQLAIYPILETAQAIRLAYEIAIASPRVSHMGGALSRFGDIHQALGYRWTAEGEETLFLRSKVLVDAKAAGIRYPISGMWGGALDDLDGLRAFATGLRNLGYYGMMLGSAEHVAAGARGVHPDRGGDRVLARARRAGRRGRARRAAARSVTATRARVRRTSCTSPTSAPPARTSPGPATSA